MYNYHIGFIGFGEVNSPRDLIEKKCADARCRLHGVGIDVIDLGIVTDDLKENYIERVSEKTKAANIDALVLCVAGWIPSYAVIRTVENFIHIPMILWGLSGYYDNGKLITTADQAGTSALRKPMKDIGFTFEYIYDMPGTGTGTAADISAGKIADCLRVYEARHKLKTARIGMMGYRDMKLYGTMFDGIKLKKILGTEIEFFEMLEVVQLAEEITESETDEILGSVQNEWTFIGQADISKIRKGIKYYLAIRRIVEANRYCAVSLTDVDGMKKLLGYPPAFIFMLLSRYSEISTIPENDALGSVTQAITGYLTGQISMYLEFYEYMHDRILCGVPDYVPMQCVEGQYKVLPSKFGLLGEGLLNVSTLKTGKVTLCRLYETEIGYGMHIIKGNAVTPHPWEEAGWQPPAPQLPGLEVVIDKNDADEIYQNIMGQHYIVLYGDQTKLLRDFCGLCGINTLIHGSFQ